MPKLLYISLMRLPTEKAHGLQIMQNCEAFAAAGWGVTLWVARRWNTRAMRNIGDAHAYYGVERNFAIERVPCIDIFPLVGEHHAGARIAFYLLQLTYALAMLIKLAFRRADIYYSRDELLLALLSWLKPKDALAYEAHLFPASGRGRRLQSRVCQSVGSVIAITPRLRADLIKDRGADPARAIAAHDGIRPQRFQGMPDREAARRRIGWSQEAFIVGYLGSLQMIGLDKGVGALLGAVAKVEGAHLALVGGSEADIAPLQGAWSDLGLPPKRMLTAGQVAPGQVPLYLRALDVCALPHPATTQFAHYTSPLKLFEYMAAGRAIAASDLPGWSDVISAGETALLLPPDDPDAWVAAIKRLRDDPELRERLGRAARVRVMARYTWGARARTILAHIQSA